MIWCIVFCVPYFYARCFCDTPQSAQVCPANQPFCVQGVQAGLSYNQGVSVAVKYRPIRAFIHQLKQRYAAIRANVGANCGAGVPPLASANVSLNIASNSSKLN